MKTREELDELEAEIGVPTRNLHVFEAYVRRMIDTLPAITSGNGTATEGEAFAALGRVAQSIDEFDVVDRDADRRNLFEWLRSFAQGYFEARVPREPAGGRNCTDRGHRSFRKAREIVAGEPRCWQHVDERVTSVARGLLRECFGDDPVYYGISDDRDDVGRRLTAGVAERWAQVRGRLARVSALDMNDDERERFDRMVSAFVERWGQP